MTAVTPFKILYVCNSNNARSPLAAAFTYDRVSRATSGVQWHISSAGTRAVDGHGARSEAQIAASGAALDLSEHRTRPLTPDACLEPDLVLAMAWDQVTDIWSRVPGAWDKVFTIKEFIHWAKQAPNRPSILFADRVEHMRDRIAQTHAIRKRARADHGFWGGMRPQDLNLIEPEGHGEEAWTTLAAATQALVNDVIKLLLPPA